MMSRETPEYFRMLCGFSAMSIKGLDLKLRLGVRTESKTISKISTSSAVGKAARRRRRDNGKISITEIVNEAKCRTDGVVDLELRLEDGTGSNGPTSSKRAHGEGYLSSTSSWERAYEYSARGSSSASVFAAYEVREVSSSRRGAFDLNKIPLDELE